MAITLPFTGTPVQTSPEPPGFQINDSGAIQGPFNFGGSIWIAGFLGDDPQLAVAQSTDGGLTWTIFPQPLPSSNSFAQPIFDETNGLIYFVTIDTAHLRVTSFDLTGLTWAANVDSAFTVTGSENYIAQRANGDLRIFYTASGATPRALKCVAFAAGAFGVPFVIDAGFTGESLGCLATICDPLTGTIHIAYDAAIAGSGFSAIAINNPGVGPASPYAVNDEFLVIQGSNRTGSGKVTSVDVNGLVTGVAVEFGGNGYSIQNNLATVPTGYRTPPGGLTINIDGVGGGVQGVTVASIGAPGANYRVNDLAYVAQGSQQSAIVKVTGIDGGGGVTAISIDTAGHGYILENGVSTLQIPTGVGLTIDITGISAATPYLLYNTLDSSDTVGARRAAATTSYPHQSSHLFGNAIVWQDLDRIVFVEAWLTSSINTNVNRAYVGTPISNPVWTTVELHPYAPGAPPDDQETCIVDASAIDGRLWFFYDRTQDDNPSTLLQTMRVRFDGVTMEAPELVWDALLHPPTGAIGATFVEDEGICATLGPSNELQMGVNTSIDQDANDTVVYFAFENAPGIALDCNDPPPGKVGQPYSHALVVTGGTPPYTFALIAGALPDGLSLDPATGVISGTPTVAGTFTFTIRVTDSADNTADVTCSITIYPTSFWNGAAEQLLCDPDYPWLFMPGQGISKNLHNSIPTPAVGVLTEIFSFTVPDGMYLVIDRIFNQYAGVGFVPGSGSILFFIDANRPIGNPLATGRPIAQFVTNVGKLDKPHPVGPLLFAGGDVIRYKVLVTDPAVGVGLPNTVSAAALGWLYPKARYA